MTQRVIIIIPAGDKKAANTVAKSEFDAVGGDKTFTNGLSASGNEPATHFWCSAMFSPDAVDKLSQVVKAFPGALVFSAGQEPDEVLQLSGLKVVGSNAEMP